MISKKIRSIYNSWISLSIGILTIFALIAGGFTWQFKTFATEKDILSIDQKISLTISQLACETLKSFKAVNDTNYQMQQSIERFELNDRYERLIEQKYRIMSLIENDPDNQELKMDLEKCKYKLLEISTKINNL